MNMTQSLNYKSLNFLIKEILLQCFKLSILIIINKTPTIKVFVACPRWHFRFSYKTIWYNFFLRNRHVQLLCINSFPINALKKRMLLDLIRPLKPNAFPKISTQKAFQQVPTCRRNVFRKS